MSAAGQRNPQHFHRPCTGLVPFYTSDPHGCAHKARPAVLLPGWQPAAGQRAGACVTRPARRTRGPGVDEIVHEGGTDGRRRFTGQAAQVLTACWPPSSRPATGLRPADPAPWPAANTPIDPARAWLPARRACTPAALPLPAFGRGAAAQGPRPSSVMTTDHRGGAFRRSPPCRTSAGAGYNVPAGQNQARPLHV